MQLSDGLVYLLVPVVAVVTPGAFSRWLLRRISAWRWVLSRSAEQALDGARKLAASMAHSAPLTIKGSKIVLEAIARNDVDRRHDAIQAVADEAMASEDYKEGVAAFAAKRDPVFKGK